jgi:hypothetical protein
MVLTARLIAVAWLSTGHALLLPTRSVPFFELLAPLAESPVIAWAELVIGLYCAASLLVGRSVRGSALTLGCLIFATTLLSRGFFSNNRLFTACVLVLVGLAAAKGAPLRILRVQVAFLYLGAGLDKLLAADWRSGAFMRSFTEELAAHGRLWAPGTDSHLPHGPVRAFAALLDALPTLAIAASWATILFELAIGVLFMIGRRRAAIVCGLLFHAGLLVYTASPLGMFFYAATAAYFAFVELPSKLELIAPRRIYGLVAKTFAAIDPDGRVTIHAGPEWELCAGGHSRTGALSPIALLAQLPAFYVLVAVLLSGPWFSPWSVLVLAPLLLLRPSHGRPPATEVAKMAGKLNP